ncbi:NUDIX hydrolase [Xanthobacter sp. TB0139]|uniref:NUDIX hydrolase n=1 Tax=Xanthobacter sp. TB0139 TaxID=3459178 RepID=UPI0040390B13
MPRPSRPSHSISVDLIAVLAAVTAGAPRVMTLKDGQALPSGPFELEHRSLQSGLRDWVEQKTHHPLGYVEQLYTFADKDRAGEQSAQRTISISYLGLTRALDDAEAGWRSWYDYFPWEDHRAGPPDLISQMIAPALAIWAQAPRSQGVREERRQRIMVTFALDDHPWNEELTLQRYELLYEAGLVPESWRGEGAETASACREKEAAPQVPGLDMIADHRRILATGIARLRAKIKYRPVVFELMPPTFTLLQLQRCVEALAGRTVHKQNFRRLMEAQELVEETGETTSETIGRPAKLFRFRSAILAERALVGTKLPLART